MPHPAACLALSLALLAPVDEPEPRELDYAALAKEFREEHGLDAAVPGALTLQDVLDTDTFRRVPIGLFDLRVPADALVERESAEGFRECALATLETQAHFASWTATGSEDWPRIAEDLDVLRKWIRSWSSGDLAAIGRNPAIDVLERLGLDGGQREAHARVEEFFCKGEYLGIVRGPEPDTQVVFLPNRRWMLHLLCFTGWNDPESRANYWKPGVEKWTSFWNEETQVVAMTYPAWPIDLDRPFKDADMDEFEKSGLGQHAAEKVSASMFWRYYGNNDALFYEAALGTMLAISIFEENNVRTGAPVYKNSGGSSAAFSVFVPGGNSAGGTLPGRGAATIIHVPLWRETKGEDHYVKPLGKAMKKGWKLAKKARHPLKDDRAHFIVEGEEESDKSFVTAPFFGPDAEAKDLPEKRYLVDYEEFFRAYRAAFFHFLRTRGMGKKSDENETRFAELNALLATRASDLTFAEAVERVYGVPLSGPDGETDSLEWRFLTYVEKGGR